MAESAGRNAAEGRLWRMTLVAAFAAVVAFAGVFTLPPLDRDEARFAQASAQMLETGDYIDIRFQDRERNKKPAGIYWLQAASVSAFSDVKAREIWAYRIPSAIAAIVAALFTYVAGARLYGPGVGLLAGVLLAAAPVFAAESTIATTDANVLASIAVAEAALAHIYLGWREGRRAGWAWPIAFWAAIGAGVLIKGPITPMVVGLTCAGIFIRTPHFGWVKAMRPVSGLLLVLAIVAPWAFAISRATQGRFFAQAVGHDMLGKVGAAQESHSGPPGYHFALVWILFWPAAALLAPGLARAWRTRDAWPSWFLLSWIAPSWLVFELVATKLPHYTLPLYPALAILAARAAATGEAARRRLWRKIGAGLYLAVGLGVAAAIAALPIALGGGTVSPAFFAGALATAAASVFAARLFWKGRALAGAYAAAALGAAVCVILLNGVLPSLSQLAVSSRLSAAIAKAGLHPLRDGAPPVALAGYSEPSAIFLLGTKTVLTDGYGAAYWLARRPNAAVVVDLPEEDDFQTALYHLKIKPRTIAWIEGLNYSKGRHVRLVVYSIAPPEKNAAP